MWWQEEEEPYSRLRVQVEEISCWHMTCERGLLLTNGSLKQLLTPAEQNSAQPQNMQRQLEGVFRPNQEKYQLDMISTFPQIL